MSSLLVFTASIAHLGSEALAANNLVLSLYLLVMVPLVGLGQGITIAVGQAMGAGRIDVVRAIVCRASALVCAVLVVATAAFLLFPHGLMSPYVAIDPQDALASAERWTRILDLGVPLMYLCAAMVWGDGMQLIWRFAVQGAGDTRWPLVVLTASAIALLGIPALVVSYVVPAATWQAQGITPLTACWMVFTLYLWLIAALMAWRYFRGPWSRMSLRE